MKTSYFIPLAIVSLTLVAGCSARIASSISQECSEQLSLAEAELDKAKADGLGQAVTITKAAALIAAAAVQKQVEAYAGCADKAQRARAYVADAQRK